MWATLRNDNETVGVYTQSVKGLVKRVTSCDVGPLTEITFIFNDGSSNVVRNTDPVHQMYERISSDLTVMDIKMKEIEAPPAPPAPPVITATATQPHGMPNGTPQQSIHVSTPVVVATVAVVVIVCIIILRNK
jgi:hypothetical protein